MSRGAWRSMALVAGACLVASTGVVHGDSLLEILKSPAGPVGVFATAVNRDCSAIVLRRGDDYSVWREGEGAVFVGTTADFGGPPRVVNKDGTAFAIRHQPAWVWTEGGGLVELGHLGDCPGSSVAALLMADDGLLVTPTCSDACDGNDEAAYARSLSGTITEFETGLRDCEPDLLILRPRALTADGTTAFGELMTSDDGFVAKAAVWTNGALSLPGGGIVYASDGAGTVLAGGIGASAFVRIDGSETMINAPSNVRPFRVTRHGTILAAQAPDEAPLSFLFAWTAAGGWRDPGQFILEEYGIDLPGAGWFGLDLIAVADDDSVLVGSGFDGSGTRYTFRICRSGQDTDGDGLDDLWERCGIPFGAEADAGVYLLDVDGDGYSDADYERKDLFVEVDAMTGFAPPDLSAVEMAFANAATVSNPDGSTGITLHAVVDETNLAHVAVLQIAPGDGGFPPSFYDYRTLHFGTVEEHGDVTLLEAKAKAYRYCLFADTDSIGNLGVANAIHGNGFIVNKGEHDPGLCKTCTAAERSTIIRSTFMHELGHTLALGHGGDEDINYKPNYISVMNYMEAVPYALSHQLWKLDYSYGTLPELQEPHLNEAAGLVDATGRMTGRRTYYGEIGCEPAPCDPSTAGAIYIRALQVGAASVDFNGDGAIEADTCGDMNFYGTATFLPGAEVASPCETLHDHDDWSAIAYAVPPQTPMPGEGIQELTGDMVRALFELLPPACHADIAPESGDGVVDVQDLLALLAAWGECSDCRADIEPRLTADHVVDVQDLLVMLSSWGECAK